MRSTSFFRSLLVVVGVLLLVMAQASAADSRPPSTAAIDAMAAPGTQSDKNSDQTSSGGMTGDAAAAAITPKTAPVDPAAAAANLTPSKASQAYVLGAGDEIKLVVYGEDDLSGNYLVGSTGIVALPLIGNVEAAGHTIHDFEEGITAKLSKGYLKDPRVSVEVANYRPFFILGEVAKPGSYPYVNGMTVLTAVALGGGYTYRGDHSDVRIVRANDPTKTEQKIKEDAIVMPGDIIRVPERLF